MQRITHLNNLQSEKKMDVIQHAKISPNKQFLLLLLLKSSHVICLSIIGDTSIFRCPTQTRLRKTD